MIHIGLNCPNLRKLNLCWNPNITDPSVKAILKGCKYLRKLKLVGLKKLTDEGF